MDRYLILCFLTLIDSRIILGGIEDHPLVLRSVLKQKFPGCQAHIDTDHGVMQINLHRKELSRFHNESARFTVKGEAPDESYTWSVCNLMSVPGREDCHEQQFVYETTERCVGLGSYANFILLDDDVMNAGRPHLTVQISKLSDPDHFDANIKLVCDRNKEGPGELTCDGISCFGPTSNQFIFRSQYACLGEIEAAAAPHQHKPWKFSPGSVVLMSGGAVFITYILIGLAYGTKKGEKGLNRLPNSDFWLELPLLVKDGVKFFFRGCRPEGVIYSPIIEDKNVPIADV